MNNRDIRDSSGYNNHNSHNSNNNNSSSEVESDGESWISQYCAMYGHEYFVEVAPEFIEDDFNLTGLNAMVPYYREALDVILELEPESEVSATTLPLVEHSADLLYGLIHARYLTTKQGLHAMADKFERNVFGSCPRHLCDGMHMIPLGRYDTIGIETVRLYCPNCNDIYLPSSSRYLNLDGAFFSTSFAGLFVRMFPEIGRQCANRQHENFKLTLFGFGINQKAVSGPRMPWLRAFPKTEQELEEFNRCEFNSPSLTHKSDQEEEDEEDRDAVVADDDDYIKTRVHDGQKENTDSNTNNNGIAGEEDNGSAMSIA